MEERNEMDKVDEVMLPGFRFHPTDEELVGFYLKRKIQQKPLCIELIRQLDIYKYDPWDLPKLATTGEKEWYFYCPRDRKYRNSARPNRVTGAGFWKATGTDRPIYSGEGTKCIGLKKSLVFYKGRAAKGVKTDWMMHEYRLPSVADSSVAKRSLDKNIPVTESWAICRIFKKANSVAQRALSHSWVSPLPAAETTHGDAFLRRSCTGQLGPDNNNNAQLMGGVNNVLQQAVHDYACFDLSTMIYKPIDLAAACSKPPPPPPPVVSSADIPPTASFIFTAQDQVQVLSKCPVDVTALLQSLPAASVLVNNENIATSSSPHLIQPQQYGGFAAGDLLLEVNARSRPEEKMGMANTRQMGISERAVTSMPFGLPPNRADGWSSSMKWDHRDISLADVTTGFPATNKCYT